MNNMYPFFPQPIQNPNIYDEIKKLKEEIEKLKERISVLEKNKKNYLQKDESFHMIWT